MVIFFFFFSCLHYAEVKNGQNYANYTHRLEHLQGQADNFLLGLLILYIPNIFST